MRYVLIIDDEEAVRDYLVTLIKRLGYAAQAAATAADGLAALRNPECHLVIADIFLPDAPASELWIQQLFEAAAGRRVVLISGAPTQELVDCAATHGMTTFLSKPFELAFIRDILKEAFDAADT